MTGITHLDAGAWVLVGLIAAGIVKAGASLLMLKNAKKLQRLAEVERARDFSELVDQSKSL